MILNNNSTQQINTLVIQLQNKITNLSNELKSLNKEIDDLDSKISDLEIKDSSQANDQANDIAEMNAEIKANTEAISGKADKNHTHIKSDITDFPTSLKNPNALTINGKTYDGSTAVDAGVQTVANGGTGVSTQADINKAFISNLDVGVSDVTDGTEFVSSWASDNGFNEPEALNEPLRRKFSAVWNYIKGKISSVLGLTASNYGGTAATILDYNRNTPIKVRWGGPGIDSAEWYPAFSADGFAIEPINRTNIHAGKADNATTADYADRLTSFASWNDPYEYDPTNGVRVYVYRITMASWFNSILVQIYDDINYARCRRYVLGLWHVDGYGYSVSVTDLGGTKDGGLHVWFGNDGNVYLQADVYWTSRIAFSRLDDITDVTITKIGAARYGSNIDINGNVLFTPLADPIVDCGALRADQNLSSAQKIPQILKTDVLKASNITSLEQRVAALESKI